MDQRSNLKPNTRYGDSYFHPYSNPADIAERGHHVIVSGKGVRVFDADGRSYIEGLAGLGCVALGFDEPRLVEAARRQLSRLPYYHSFGRRAPDVSLELADRIKDIAPMDCARVFFTSSGSEAVDTAIKLVWYLNNALGRPKKKKIIGRMNAYHGVTVASASVGGLPRNWQSFDLPIAGFIHTRSPYFYRDAATGETDEEYSTRCAAELENLIVSEGADTVAAFFAEPIIGAGGTIPPPRTYFEKVQKVLKRHDVLLLADEVYTGFGRTGEMFASSVYGIEPDLVTCGKALTSAYVPLSAVLISRSLTEIIDRQSAAIGIFGHGLTYTGHPVACAVALEVLDIFEERAILQQVRAAGSHLQASLARLSSHPLVGDVRGVGLLGGLEIVENKETKKLFDDAHHVLAFAVERVMAHGAIVRFTGNAISVCPPLIIDTRELDELVGAVEKGLDETATWLKVRT